MTPLKKIKKTRDALARHVDHMVEVGVIPASGGWGFAVDIIAGYLDGYVPMTRVSGHYWRGKHDVSNRAVYVNCLVIYSDLMDLSAQHPGTVIYSRELHRWIVFLDRGQLPASAIRHDDQLPSFAYNYEDTMVRYNYTSCRLNYYHMGVHLRAKATWFTDDPWDGIIIRKYNDPGFGELRFNSRAFHAGDFGGCPYDRPLSEMMRLTGEPDESADPEAHYLTLLRMCYKISDLYQAPR